VNYEKKQKKSFYVTPCSSR